MKKSTLSDCCICCSASASFNIYKTMVGKPIHNTADWHRHPKKYSVAAEPYEPSVRRIWISVVVLRWICPNWEWTASKNSNDYVRANKKLQNIQKKNKKPRISAQFQTSAQKCGFMGGLGQSWLQSSPIFAAALPVVPSFFLEDEESRTRQCHGLAARQRKSVPHTNLPSGGTMFLV